MQPQNPEEQRLRAEEEEIHAHPASVSRTARPERLNSRYQTVMPVSATSGTSHQVRPIHTPARLPAPCRPESAGTANRRVRAWEQTQWRPSPRRAGQTPDTPDRPARRFGNIQQERRQSHPFAAGLERIGRGGLRSPTARGSVPARRATHTENGSAPKANAKTKKSTSVSITIGFYTSVFIRFHHPFSSASTIRFSSASPHPTPGQEDERAAREKADRRRAGLPQKIPARWFAAARSAHTPAQADGWAGHADERAG